MSSAATESAAVLNKTDVVANGLSETVKPCENGFLTKNEAKDYLVEIVSEAVTEDVPEDDDEEKESTNLVVAKVIEVQDDVSDCGKESQELILTNGHINEATDDDHKESSEILLNINKSESQQLSKDNLDNSVSSFVKKKCKNIVNNNVDCNKDKKCNNENVESTAENSLKKYASENVHTEDNTENKIREGGKCSPVEEKILNNTLKLPDCKNLINTATEETQENNKGKITTEESKIMSSSSSFNENVETESNKSSEEDLSFNVEVKEKFTDSCKIISENNSESKNVDNISSELHCSLNDNCPSSNNISSEENESSASENVQSVSEVASECISDGHSTQSTVLSLEILHTTESDNNTILDGDQSLIDISSNVETNNVVNKSVSEVKNNETSASSEKFPNTISRRNSIELKGQTKEDSSLPMKSEKENEHSEKLTISEIEKSDGISKSKVNKESVEKSGVPLKSILKRRSSKLYDEEEHKKKKLCIDNIITQNENGKPKRKKSTDSDGLSEKKVKLSAGNKEEILPEKKVKLSASKKEEILPEKKVRLSSDNQNEIKKAHGTTGIETRSKLEKEKNCIKNKTNGEVIRKNKVHISSSRSLELIKKSQKNKKEISREKRKYFSSDEHKRREEVIKKHKEKSSRSIKHKKVDDSSKEKPAINSKISDVKVFKQTNKDRPNREIEKKTKSQSISENKTSNGENKGSENKISIVENQINENEIPVGEIGSSENKMLIGENHSNENEISVGENHSRCPFCSCDCKIKNIDKKESRGRTFVEVLQDAPGNININLVQKLEELVAQTVADWAANKCEVGALRKRAHYLEGEHDRLLQLTVALKKQLDDAKCIMKRMIDEKIAQKSWAECIIPLKVTRSVGMQVCTTGSAHVLIKPPDSDKELSPCTSDSKLNIESNKENERTSTGGSSSNSHSGETENIGVTEIIGSQQNLQNSSGKNSPNASQLNQQLLKQTKTILPDGLGDVGVLEDNDIEEIQVIESPTGVINNRNIQKISEVNIPSSSIIGAPTTSTATAIRESTPTIYILKPSDVGIPSRNIRQIATTINAGTVAAVATTPSVTPITSSLLSPTATPITIAKPTVKSSDSEVIDLTDNEPTAHWQNKRDSASSNTSRLQQQIRFSSPQATKLVIQSTIPGVNKTQVVTFPADSTTKYVFQKPKNPPLQLRKNPVISPKERLLTAMSTLPPLPRSPVYLPNIPRPPKPILRICKNTSGIMLSWNFDDHIPTTIKKYQVFAYQEGNPVESTRSETWKRVGDVDALPLPMACTLTQFKEGHKYFFVVRAMDLNTRLGEFSLPGSIMLTTTNSRV